MTLKPLIGQARAALARGSLVQAEHYCREALKVDKQNFELLSLAGLIAAQKEDFDEASRLFRRSLKIRPADGTTHYHIGRCSIALGKHDDAIISFRRAITLQPENVDAHAYLAIALSSAGSRREADTVFQRSLALQRDNLLRQPGNVDGWRSLATAYDEMGDVGMAMSCCCEILAIDPESAWARGAEVMYKLPSVYDDGEDAQAAASAFNLALADLDKWLEAARPQDGFSAFDRARVFFLAYREQDNLELLTRYGNLCARTLARWLASQHIARRPSLRDGKIHVGIVVADRGRNSVRDAIHGAWLQHLDRRRFQLRLFHLVKREGESADTESVDLSSMPIEGAVRAIAAHAPDVLVYPAIGMNPKVAALASLRLAPIQVASWGHPETTGLPTIDYFVSAEALEPPDAQQHYRERLVVLPDLGCCYERSGVVPIDPPLARLGIARDRPLLICPGTPFKYAPEHDQILVELARRLGKCQFVFFRYARTFFTQRLQNRLEAVFARNNLALEDYAVFVPWLSRGEYYGLLRRATMQLDTIGFSGFNTAMHSVECSLPIVTREGAFLRGRLASGILKRMNLPELVAASEAEYIELAVKLASDRGFHRQIRDRIESAREVLFDDLGAVRAFEAFLKAAVGSPA